MVKILKQNINYINDNITIAFKNISVDKHYKLIGSKNIRNLLYSNDYDINETLPYSKSKLLDTKFLYIFKFCLKDPNYYILDFKCGVDIDNNSIHWATDEVFKGFKVINNRQYLFIDCIQQKELIKIDICYLLNGEFIDITNNYYFQNSPQKSSIVKNLQENIDELLDKQQYFKAIKRLFSIEMIKGNVSDELLNFLNSDYGRLYKVIHDLNMVVIMMNQTFKQIKITIIKDNLQRIKEFLSLITELNIDKFVNLLIKCINNLNVNKLESLILDIEQYFNNKLKLQLKKFI